MTVHDSEQRCIVDRQSLRSDFRKSLVQCPSSDPFAAGEDENTDDAQQDGEAD
jgi:hypothetical protein